MQDSKQATRKRIESLKKSSDDSPGRKARASPFKASKPPGAVEAEQKAPKKLSQIKVDPSIAKSLAGLSRGPSPAPGPTSSAVASQTPAATDMLDLLGNEAPATDPKPTATNVFPHPPPLSYSPSPALRCRRAPHCQCWFQSSQRHTSSGFIKVNMIQGRRGLRKLFESTSSPLGTITYSTFDKHCRPIKSWWCVNSCKSQTILTISFRSCCRCCFGFDFLTNSLRIHGELLGVPLVW